MEHMDGWRIGIMVVVVYVAVTSLVRMMINRRDEMIERFRREMKNEQRKQMATEPEEAIDTLTTEVEIEQDKAA